VRRVIYVSSTATVAPPPPGEDLADERHRFAAAPGLGTYHDLKWAMEALADDETRLELVTVCPGACLGPWDLRVGTSALIVATARGLDPPHPDGTIALVDARDVAEALVRLARHPAPPRRLLLAAGNHRLHPLLEALARRYGRPPPRPALAAADAIALADAEEARVRGTRARPALFREIVDLVVHGTAISSRLAETTLGIRWRPLAETLDAYDSWARRMRILPAPQAEAPT
jgi:nucleoside-diphosphate-sugar epimerase